MDSQVALLITPIASHKALAALGKLASVSGSAFATAHGGVFVLDDAQFDHSHQSAADMSSALREVDTILLRRGPSEDPADSDVQAVKYRGGQMGEKMAPGLIISGLEPLCERLILGALSTEALLSETDAIHSSTLSKFAAIRALAAGRKKQS